MISTHRSRVRTIYVLIGLNMLLLVVSVGVLAGLLHVQHRLDTAERTSYQSCQRGNVLREGYRFAMTELGRPGLAADPQVQKQDCAVLYPGGVK